MGSYWWVLSPRKAWSGIHLRSINRFPAFALCFFSALSQIQQIRFQVVLCLWWKFSGVSTDNTEKAFWGVLNYHRFSQWQFRSSCNTAVYYTLMYLLFITVWSILVSKKARQTWVRLDSKRVNVDPAEILSLKPVLQMSLCSMPFRYANISAQKHSWRKEHKRLFREMATHLQNNS